jgi:glycosyltransferase involved in cell wall biosynthesis
LHRATAVVALGNRAANNIKNVYGYSSEITVIPATVADYRNIDITKHQRSGRKTIGIIGRLVAHKRHNELLMAIKDIRNTGRDVGLVIAGDGPMRQALEDETRQLGLSDVVKFTGEFERIEDVMSLFDIFAITSISESQCMPILESGAFGKPVIAADSGGMPDFVDDGVTGIIVPIGDHNALVAALIRLIDDSALCERMGQAGRRRYLERHTPDRIADLHDDLNLRLLADRPGVGLHVAYIVECYATFIVDEINMLRRLGVKVSLFNAFRPTPESDPKKEDFRRESHYFPSGYRGVFLANVSAFVRRPIGYLRALWLVSREGESLRMLLLAGFLARIVRSEQIDHFHGTFGTRTTTLAALLSFLTGRTYSFTTHAYDIYRPNPSLVWKTNGAAFMRTISDFNKQFIEQTYLGIEAKKILVGYLGISSEMFNSKIKCYNYIKEPISIIAVGSLIEQKGHIILIRACRILNDRGYDLTCLLIGDGEKRGLIIDEIQRQGLKNIIRLLGLLPHANIISYLLSADIFALPCMDLRGKGEHIDGIPVALMEAMAVGLPTIATRISGIPELIEDGVSGLLVPEKDEIALADAIARLIEDPDLRASLGHGARRRIEERFDLGRNVHLLANEFCRAIGIPFQEGCEVHTEERSRGLSPEPQRES